MLRIVVKAIAAVTGLHAIACVLLGGGVLFRSCGERSSLGVAGMAVGCALIALGYFGVFAAGGLWDLEERGRRASIGFVLALAVVGVGCAVARWRVSFVGVAWQAAVLSVLFLPATRRACGPGAGLDVHA